jgi:hypothetical protein
MRKVDELTKEYDEFVMPIKIEKEENRRREEKEARKAEEKRRQEEEQRKAEEKRLQ